jgi:hypothetical protein
MCSAGSTAHEERMTPGGSAQEDIALLLPEVRDACLYSS